MIRKNSIFTAVVLGAASFAAAADTVSSRVVYSGSHEPVRLIQVVPQIQTSVPYALTGSDRVQNSIRTENIWVGSRFVGARVVGQ